MMIDQSISPDTDSIKLHLQHITRRWHELDEPCLLEVVHLSADDRAKVVQTSHYTADDSGIELATSDIATFNKNKINSYATVNPVSATNRPPAHKRSSAQHILASFFHFADADDAQAAENIRNFVGPKPTFYVMTGTTPSQRPHVYWEIKEPTRNMDAWSKTQAAIAATLKTDSVIDAPRIMRVAGTINWPKPQKEAKGYQIELTSLHIHDENTRPPVTSENMARAFRNSASKENDGLQIDTGGFDGDRMNVSATIGAIQSGENWNKEVNRLVWRMASLGLSDSEIALLAPSLTLPGYTIHQTQEEMRTMLSYARESGHQPRDQVNNEFREVTDAEKNAISAMPFNPWKPKNLAEIPVPEFVYSDFYARKYTSLTIAAPKVGKSMLGLIEAVDMATGRGILTGVRQPKRTVFYYNAEDDQSVLDNRVAAILTEYGIPQEDISTLEVRSGVEDEDFYMMSGIDGIINEKMFISIEKSIVENGIDVLVFDPLQDLSRSPETNEVFRLLGQRLRRMASSTSAALGLIHHTRKVAPGMTPSIDDARGGSALRGTARFNRVLVSMSEDEAAQAGVDNHHHFLRIGDMESNLAPPSSDINRWFEKVSVIVPADASFGVIKPWSWPDAFSGVTKQDAAKIRHRIDGIGVPPRADVRSASWVGVIIAEELGIDLESKGAKAKVKTLLSGWLKSDVLRMVSERDKRAGRDVNVVISGGNNPLVEGGDA